MDLSFIILFESAVLSYLNVSNSFTMVGMVVAFGSTGILALENGDAVKRLAEDGRFWRLIEIEFANCSFTGRTVGCVLDSVALRWGLMPMVLRELLLISRAPDQVLVNSDQGCVELSILVFPIERKPFPLLNPLNITLKTIESNRKIWSFWGKRYPLPKLQRYLFGFPEFFG